MAKEFETGITDKRGKPIHFGDIVQYQLSGFGKAKSGGPRRYRIVGSGNKIELTWESETDISARGVRFRESDTKFMTVVDCNHFGANRPV